jgi:cell division protein FtsI (penicillin-binding protein 3)
MSTSPARVRLCLVLLVAALAALVGRAAWLQVRDGERLAALSARQSSRDITVAPRRGAIYDRDGGPLALSVEAESIYARPARVRPRDLGPLAAALGVPAAEVRARLESRRPFVWLRRQAAPAAAARVRALDLPGVGFATEFRRVYPNGPLAGHLVGFAGLDGQGLEGVERAFDALLRGDAARRAEGRDARGRGLLSDGLDAEAVAPEGPALVLTIDRRIQFAAEEALGDAIREADASGGTAIVLDPTSGEVLALANAPAFDPNGFADARPAAWRNRAITDAFEPGSTVKVFLAAAALEARLVDAEERFFAERGTYYLGRQVVRDVHPAAWLTLPEILQVSSNIGAIKVGARVGAERYRRALAGFGFGRRTGIALPGEAEGALRPARQWTPVGLATASYGYGLAATPIQIAAAFAAVANGGLAVTPRLARGSLDAEGTLTPVERRGAGREVRRIIAPETARRLTSMLEAVVGGGGTGRPAAVPGYAVAGKTGTARKVDEAGGYARDRYVASFVGFVPADAPRFVVAVFVDEPRTSIFGGAVAAPAFRQVAAAALEAYRVPPPRRPEAPAGPESPSRATPATASEDGPRPDQATSVARPGAVVLAAAPGGARTPAVPDFRAMGVREALRAGRAAGLHVEVAGSGWAVDQRPAPGAPRPRDGRVTVSFRP